MRPYCKEKASNHGSTTWTKGLSGTRKSKDTPHRRRCLRWDKHAARQNAELQLDQEWKKMVEQSADLQAMNEYYDMED